MGKNGDIGQIPVKNSAFQPSDNLGSSGIGFGTSPVVEANDTYRTGAALMGRLHYSYDNRYMITGTVRRDGYSAFGQANPYAVFAFCCIRLGVFRRIVYG